MIKQLRRFSTLLIPALCLGAFFAIVHYETQSSKSQDVAFNFAEIFIPHYHDRPHIVLVDPEMAPPDIHDEVMKGYWILMDTPTYAKKYCGDRLCCCNCHFQGGNNLGGKNGSISLVGVSHVYPRYSERKKRDINLAERVNACFERSMNGKALPEDCPEMKAIIAYLNWISMPAKDEKEYPWMGLATISYEYKPDPKRGKELYQKNCAKCHMENGQGTKLPRNEQVLNIPPLWGDEAFNDGAGMSYVDNLAPFIWLNMPLKDPYLNGKEAMDIAEYISQQPRPEFKK